MCQKSKRKFTQCVCEKMCARPCTSVGQRFSFRPETYILTEHGRPVWPIEDQRHRLSPSLTVGVTRPSSKQQILRVGR